MIFKPIPPSSIIVTSFPTYKQWEMNDTSSIQYYHGEYFSGVFYNSVITDSTKIDNIYYEFAIHQSVNSMLFRDYQDKPNELLYNITNKQERNLYENVHVFSVPQHIYGESILKNSIELDIELPNQNKQLLSNNLFNNDNTIVSYSYNDVITYPNLISESVWFESVEGATHQIYSGSLHLTKPISTQLAVITGYKIPASYISTSNYLLKFNIEQANYTLPKDLQITAWQPALTSSTIITTSISEFNTPKEILLPFTSGAYGVIMIDENISGSLTSVFSDISLYKVDEHNLIDDSYGNLVDISYSQSSATVKNELDNIKIADWNFRNGYQKKNNHVSNIYTRDFSIYKNHGMCTNIEFKDGIISTLADFNKYEYKTVDTITVLLKDQYNNIIEQDVNLQLYSPNSYIRINNNSDLNLYNFKREEEFAISGILKFNQYA